MAITVLFAQLSPPGAVMSLYGLKVPYPLLPFAQLAMSYLFTQQVPLPLPPPLPLPLPRPCPCPYPCPCPCPYPCPYPYP
jgi:hypothetical protein